MTILLTGRFSNLLGPYEKWMFDAGKSFDLPGLDLDRQAALSCVAELDSPADPASFLTVTRSLNSAKAGYMTKLPTLFLRPGFKTRFLPFVVEPAPAGPYESASVALLDQTAADLQNFTATFQRIGKPGTLVQGRFRANFPLRKETLYTGDFAERQPAYGATDDLPVRKPKVILAVIDLGIPFAHRAFLDPATGASRVDFCWVQSAPSDQAGTVLFGKEILGSQIDQARRQHKGDEDAIYHAFDVLRRRGSPPMPLDRSQSHGAHVLDLMAGAWPAETAAEARIIAVDLPATSIWDTSGFGKDMYVLSALHYIFDRADLVRQAHGCEDLPLVINLSYGHSGGPHDGTGLLEEAMDELISFRNGLAPTVLALPSGNMFHDRLCARLTEDHFAPDPDAAGGRRASLRWFAPPSDRTSSFVEFWYPPGITPEDIRISVTEPGSRQIVTLGRVPDDTPDFTGQLIMVDGRAVGQVSLDLHRKRRWRAMVILAPTETHLPPEALKVGETDYGPAPSGTWTITFHLRPGLALPETVAGQEGRLLPGGIQCRIQRDTGFGQGNTGAQQSYFLDDLDPPFAENGALSDCDQSAQGAALRRYGSLNGMATGSQPIVVGGHIALSGKPAPYSGAGALAAASASGAVQPVGRCVDLSAPSERSASLTGLRGAGTRSGLRLEARGTSSASPLAARAIAEMFLAVPVPPGLTREALLLRLAAHQAAEPVPTSDPALHQRQGSFRLTPPLT